jgi:hypothetical protein
MGLLVIFVLIKKKNEGDLQSVAVPLPPSRPWRYVRMSLKDTNLIWNYNQLCFNLEIESEMVKHCLDDDC